MDPTMTEQEKLRQTLAAAESEHARREYSDPFYYTSGRYDEAARKIQNLREALREALAAPKKKTMPPETLSALRDAIRHWEENARAKTPGEASTQPDACALCLLFNKETSNNYYQACTGCPVKNATGLQFCMYTPFASADSAYKIWSTSKTDTTRERFHLAARMEIAFLTSLLPRD